jgi:two-component system, chemotaxis family, CheB/CheR fusion protein
VDPELRVTIWNRRAEDLWGWHSNEVLGKHLLNLDIGWPTEQLKQPIRACLARESEIECLTLEGMNRRGKPIQLQMTCTPLGRGEQEPHGVILFIEVTEAMGRSR